jgi:hypothetical protein
MNFINATVRYQDKLMGWYEETIDNQKSVGDLVLKGFDRPKPSVENHD